MDSMFVWAFDGKRFSYLGFYRKVIERVSGLPLAEYTAHYMVEQVCSLGVL